MKKREFLTMALAFASSAAIYTYTKNPFFSASPEEDESLDSYTIEDFFLPIENQVKPFKGQIIEFFWHGCPHCKSFAPKLEAWEKENNFVVTKLPAASNPEWRADAKLVFALSKLTNDYEHYHLKLFDLKEEIGYDLTDSSDLKDLVRRLNKEFPKYSLSYDEIQSEFDSKALNFFVDKLASDIKKTGINGVPSIVVDGLYSNHPMLDHDEKLISIEYALKNIISSNRL